MAQEPQLMYLNFGERTAREPVHLTPLKGGKYRVEDVFDCVMSDYGDEEPVEELRYHDVIQAEEIGKDRLRFVRVDQRSDLTQVGYICPRRFYLSAEMNGLWRRLGEQGGASQLEMGILTVSIPRSREKAFQREYGRHWKAWTRQAKPSDYYWNLVETLRQRGCPEETIEALVRRCSAHDARVFAQNRKRSRITWRLINWIRVRAASSMFDHHRYEKK
jgi:hypothetical protein